MAISKVIYKSSASATPETWMDATTATAAAADVIAPKTAMLADGVVTTGTGSGGRDFELLENAIINISVNDSTLPEKLILRNCTTVQARGFGRITGCKILVLPALTSVGIYAFADSTDAYETIDLGGTFNNLNQWYFSGARNLSVLIIRNASAVTCAGVNVFNATPFASDGTGGTLYVPNDLISTYQSATNWSTILGYANNQIKSIESTHTDPNAPIDLTLYYADGSAISTT